MRCVECGYKGEMRTESGVYEYDSLPGVTLHNVTYRHCPQCEAEYLMIPAMMQLNSLLASDLAKKASPLTPDEFRFLRKTLGWSSQDTSRRLGVTAETVSRWEHGKRTIGPTADRLMRMCVALFEPIDDYSENALEYELDEAGPVADPAHAHLEFTDDGWQPSLAA